MTEFNCDSSEEGLLDARRVGGKLLEPFLKDGKALTPG